MRRFLLGMIPALAAMDAHAVIVLTANLTNAQESPAPVLTTATGAPRPASFGTAMFSLNDAGTALSFTATITNIDVTGTQTADVNDNLVNAHIHASAGGGTPTFPVVWGFFGMPDNDNAPDNLVVTPFATGVGGTFSSTWDLNEGNNTTLAAQLPNILAGRSYINFHTVQNAGGEIRGQILPIPEPSTYALMGIGLLGLFGLTRRRSCPGGARR
jgi:hypothetical protein